MIFANKIMAIKRLREVSAVDTTATITVNGVSTPITVKGNHVGLKEAKDLVEDIMEYGVYCFLEDQLSKRDAGGDR